jgi:hypothetical protein
MHESVEQRRGQRRIVGQCGLPLPYAIESHPLRIVALDIVIPGSGSPASTGSPWC